MSHRLLTEHWNYISDPIRMKQWRAAIGATVRPGAIVADLGSGTGILGLLALQAGAARVYSIESTPDMLTIATRIAAENGFADRFFPIAGLSTEVSLPERVDVLIADQIGYFAYNAGLFGYFGDACRRFLAPDGVALPHSVTLHAAPVEAQRAFNEVDFWSAGPEGFSMKAAWEHARQTLSTLSGKDSELLGEPVSSDPLPLQPPPTGLIRLRGDSIANRDGTLHGIAGYFTAELAPGISVTNSPNAADSIRRAVSYLPLPRPIPLRAGDTVGIRVLVRPVEMLASWTVDAGGERFTQSNFPSASLPGEETSPTARPIANERARARSFAIQAADGSRTLEEIGRELVLAFPELFPELAAAQAFAARHTGGA